MGRWGEFHDNVLEQHPLFWALVFWGLITMILVSSFLLLVGRIF